jgi:surface antigen
VSYAAWRLSETGHAISNDRDQWSSAANWDAAATRLGFIVDVRAAVGSIAQWHAGERSIVWSGGSAGVFTAGDYGHVAYVTAVYPDGSVQVAQYNATGNRAFSSMHLRAPRFVHLS